MCRDVAPSVGLASCIVTRAEIPQMMAEQVPLEWNLPTCETPPSGCKWQEGDWQKSSWSSWINVSDIWPCYRQWLVTSPQQGCFGLKDSLWSDLVVCSTFDPKPQTGKENESTRIEAVHDSNRPLTAFSTTLIESTPRLAVLQSGTHTPPRQ